MNEKDLGHGAKRGPNWSHKVERWLRPPVGKSEVPFDWNKGANSIANLTVPIKNQANSDSCGGQAASYAMAIAFALLSGTYTELSAKSIYSRIFYPDGGTTTGSVENIFKQDGATLESEVPSYINGLCTEAWMENIAWETPGLLQEAMTRSGFTPLSVLLDIDSFAQAIRDYGFVIMMIDDQEGTITTATTASSCTLTFAKAWTNTPVCTVSDNSTASFADISSISPTAVTFGLSVSLTGGNIYYQCGYHR